MSKLRNIVTRSDKDLGFGSRSLSNSGRLITKDGEYNTSFAKKGIGELNAYYRIIHMSWIGFFLTLVIGYVLVNISFASLYFLSGVENLSGGADLEGWNAFFYCFYFSTQTLTTVGFGNISPIGHMSNIIAASEAMVGLIGFAFGTGITYGRFSKAKTRIFFSDHALITPFRDKTAVKVRFVNRRKNRLIGMKATMTISYLDIDPNTTKKRRYYKGLPLEIDSITLLPLPWTVVHMIDKDSPLFGKSKDDLEAMDAELVLILSGYDDTFDQQVHRINSYKYHEFLFDREFEPMFTSDERTGTTRIDLDKLSLTRLA